MLFEKNFENISAERMKIIPELLNKISNSNSLMIVRMKKELASVVLSFEDNVDIFEIFNELERIFVKNNLPLVGKMYRVFDTLHSNFSGFNFTDSTISPVLKKKSNNGRKTVVFGDLIKSAFGSNNRSVKDYINNIEFCSKLYDSIKIGQVKYDNLSKEQKLELVKFSKHLATLYNNTVAGKNEREFKHTNDVLIDILELQKKLSPDGSLDYNLGDRAVSMFCHFAGFDTVEEVKAYIEHKITTANKRNKEAAKSDLVLEEGDFIKGISGGIKYLGNILQNGSVSKEFLGVSADSDLTPLDTDLSMITSVSENLASTIGLTAASRYTFTYEKDDSKIWLVLKHDDRFITTRDKNSELDVKTDLSKMEAFYTGIDNTSNSEHYGIRTGFASSEINYIIVDKYDSRIGLEIAMNGFYIPVYNKEGKIIFTPKDYDELRKKMNGLSYYGIDTYVLDESVYKESREISNILENMEANKEETKYKADLLKDKLKLGASKLGLELKDMIDLSRNSVTLFNTGSTGRFTNLPGDGDFDYTMQVDREIYFNDKKMDELREKLISVLRDGEETYNIVSGDIRELKTTVEDEMGNKYKTEIDITFTTKTDETEYASDVCVNDRLNSINSEQERNLVKANIILAKQFLKSIGAYKPARKFPEQGGMGGIGVENWILQNGGTLYSAAKSFMEEAKKHTSFESFKSVYSLPNFGYNHMAYKRGFYPHDDYISNMNQNGFDKMKNALSIYIKKYEKNVDSPVIETVAELGKTDEQTDCLANNGKSM